MDPQRELEAELRHRLHQQFLISELGLRALRCDDLDILLDEASRITAEGLESNFSKVLEFLPPENRLLVRAGVGWAEGTIGVVKVDADLASPGGYALHTGAPVISNHLTAEGRFRTPKLLTEHGVKRAINVIIQAGAEPFGVLEVDSRKAGKFTEHDINFLQAAANIIGAAIVRWRAEEALRATAAQKTTLLSELTHRIKNNLQVVSSLLMIEARRIKDAKARDGFQAVRGRVDVLSRLHDQLHQTGEIARVNFGQYLQTLVSGLSDFHGTRSGPVELQAEADEMTLPIDRAIPLALIVNELVTNALKHAFPEDGAGLVRVTLRRRDDGSAVLTVADNGLGSVALSPSAENGFGRQLISALAGQIGADLAIEEDGGTAVTVSVPAASITG